MTIDARRAGTAAIAAANPVLQRKRPTGPTVFQCIARLPEEQAAQVMKTKPTRLPSVVLEHPHEAAPPLHDDWTIVEGPRQCPERYARELKLRDARNRLIYEYLTGGRSVFYSSTGGSMAPLLQSGDFAVFHPIQAVTAMDGMHTP